MSAKFMTFFVSCISYRHTDLSLLKWFSKHFSLEDFQKFQEIPAYCGLDFMILNSTYCDSYKLWYTINLK